jgi:hypothetical protein
MLFTVCLCMLACVKDGGNYDYVQVNNVNISGIDPQYTLNMLDTLRIETVLTGELNPLGEMDNYAFVWILAEGHNNPNVFSYPDTLSTEKDLDVVITQIPGNYRLAYKVKDLATDVEYYHAFNLEVLSEFQRGLLTLSEVNGDAVVSFISITGVVYPNVYYNINGEHAGRNPLVIDLMGRPPLNYIAIICQDERGGVFTSSVSFAKMMEYGDYFYNRPAVINPQAFITRRIIVTALNFMEVIFESFTVNDNQLHFKDLNHTVNVDGTVNHVENKFYDPYDGDFKVSPVRFYMINNIHYDALNQRFMFIPNLHQPHIRPHVSLPDNPHFDPADVGMELVWGRQSFAPLGQIWVNSLFRNESGKLHLLRWRNNFPSANIIQPIANIALNPDWNIHQSETFAGNIKHDYIYYALGSKVFLYDIVTNQEREIYNFGGSTVVDQVKVHEVMNTENVLFVATSEPGGGMSGSVHEMLIGPGGDLSIRNSYPNMAGRIVSMTWKNN